MRMALIGFAMGAACLQVQAALPSSLAMAISLAAVVASLLVWRRIAARVRPVLRGMAALLAGGVAGFLWAAWLAQRALAPQLALADEGRDLHIVGTVDNLPYKFSQGVRFNFAVERADGVVPPRITLSWYAGYRDQRNDVPDVQPGERWQLTVRLQRPHGNVNPYVCAGWFRKTASYRFVGSGHLWRLHSLAPHITHDMETDALESSKTEAGQSNRADKVDLHN